MDRKYFIAELVAIKAHVERVIRELEQPDAEESRPAPQGAHPPAPPPSQIRDPLAKTMADLVTPKQLGLIRALGREKGVDWEEECRGLFNCGYEELSKRAASSFIDHLRGLQESDFTVRRAS